ncbi:DUF434 domain-containing protein [Acetobacterium bakii]|uniref:DUF434 domain-containing protein n=1 Tax=Acetobacterium bakii TaxID=52689 RepID=A0A0L6TWD6_9FIRM|nr:DUF434 domain-containing protein [Acetobacterium bakii]KNZ40578.1 hypothetical protein AKG39_16640 [Acetobacterium bakii]
MASKTTRRGFNPDDRKWFSDEALTRLGIVQEEVQWLLDRNYKMGTVIEFVGNHHQLSIRQRTALQRATASQLQYEKRQANRLPLAAARDGCLSIDGFNLIITLEVALSKGLIILGKDDVLRDLAGLRGSYSLIDQTDSALRILGESLRKLSVPEAMFYLDAPVSNSGRLRNRILEHAQKWNIPVAVELVPNADTVLSKMGRIVTGDSVILDQCTSWFNLSGRIVEDYIKDAWIVSFNK